MHLSEVKSACFLRMIEQVQYSIHDLHHMPLSWRKKNVHLNFVGCSISEYFYTVFEYKTNFQPNQISHKNRTKVKHA